MAEHTSNAPVTRLADSLWEELCVVKADRDILLRQRDAALAERDRLRAERKRLRRFVHDHRVCLTMQLREGRGVKERAERLLKELDAALAGEPCEDAALAERDRLLDDLHGAARDWYDLRAAARAFLALLDRHQFSSVALRGKKLDDLRSLCE